MRQRELLGVTKDGNEVYVDMETSHAATHFKDTPKLLAVVQKIISTLELSGSTVRFDTDTGEEVGHSDLVETDEKDEIVYARRPRRKQYSRFVKNKTPSPSSWVTIALRKIGEKRYSLYTAFVGRSTPSFPGGNYLPEQSKQFWANHALVWGSQEIVPGTETTECPW